MISVDASVSEMTAAGKVASIASLESVVLLHCAAERDVAEFELSPDYVITTQGQHQYLGYRRIDDQRIQVRIGATVLIGLSKAQEYETGKDLAKLSVVYGAIYFLSASLEGLEKGDLPAFAKLNGTYNCWPYLRSEVSQLSGQMNLTCVLPLLKINVGETRTMKDQNSRLDVQESKLYSPGETVLVSGHYELIGPRGGRTGKTIQVHEGDRFPPSPKPRMRYRPRPELEETNG